MSMAQHGLSSQLQPEEFEIAHGSLRARVSSYGASLRRVFAETAQGPLEIIWGYSGTANKKGGQGDVLAPFPGRLVGGRYGFGGATYQMKLNDKDGPNAIHGFLRAVDWEVSSRALDRIEFERSIQRDEFEGYPFEVEVAVAYRLSEAGFECAFRMKNRGAEPAPVGVGFHPYFTVGTSQVDQAILRSPAREIVELGPDLLPTGSILPVRGNEMDFLEPRAIGGLRINHCLTKMDRGQDGMARVELSSPTGDRRTTVWMDEAFRYLVLYTGDAIPGEARKSLAIEPMTCATDAFNRPSWGLRVLAPGQEFSGRYGITIEPGGPGSVA